MSKVYVVWGFTDDGSYAEIEVLGVFSSLSLAEARVVWRSGDEEWESQSITAYEVNKARLATGPEIGQFIKRVEVRDLPLPSEVSDE